jgi:hypothetical protein
MSQESYYGETPVAKDFVESFVKVQILAQKLPDFDRTIDYCLKYAFRRVLGGENVLDDERSVAVVET